MNTRSCVTVTWREGTHLFLAIPAARGPQVSLIRRKQAASARVLQRQQQQARRLSRAQVRGFSLVNRRYFTAGNTGMYMISLKKITVLDLILVSWPVFIMFVLTLQIEG